MSAIPGSVTYLFGLAQRVTTTVPGAVAHDSWTDARSPIMFGVGVMAPPFFEAEEQAAIIGTPSWVGLPAELEEVFDIPCYIYVGQGDIDNAVVRASAFAMWDAFLPLLRADLSLGGLVYVAEISRFSARGPRNSEEAEGGRYCLIQFGIRGKNLAPVI